MSFPATRHSLIQRLAVTGAEEDWRQFLEDYWQPVCRFAANWGRLRFEDAEDVGSATFQVVLAGNLLQRWLQQPTAKLRTLLCSVVRKVLANRERVNIGRQQLLRENRELLQELMSIAFDGDELASSAPQDAFYAAWAEELITGTLRTLHAELLESGRADQFRVLFGRVCEGLTTAEVADCLGLPATTVENHFKRTKQRLADQLEQAARRHVTRYCPVKDVEAEFQNEWQRLGEFLARQGGFDGMLRQTFDRDDGISLRPRGSAIMQSVLKTLTKEHHS
ncbi:MAG: sigma-70 family RNA polymerase sigma factor [Planctomycetaceae bacterium]|nr:sigma-70 family RNA polymerase sigma factor [Planctomycetaceae bacterium]